jgi:hypothetical protein
MAGALPKIFATMARDAQRVAAGLSLDPNNRASTLRELITLKRKLGDVVVNNPDYQREVQKLLNEFGSIKDLSDQFIGSTIDDYKPQKRLYDAILKANIDITKDALLGGGIRENFANAIQEVLKSNISGISDRATLYETLARFIEGTEKQKGFLDRYIKQTTNDAIMVFGREYLQTVSEDIGLKHYLYQGTIIADTRQFCQSKAGKYFTREEVEKWASQTWEGKMAGTNSTTIFSYAGGYNCRHKIWPVTEEQYNRAKGITPPAATPPPTPPQVVAPPPPAIPPQITEPPVVQRPPRPPKQPKAPQGFYGDTSKLPTTKDGLAKYMSDVLTRELGIEVSKIQISPNLSVEMMQKQVASIERLAKTYKIGSNHDLSRKSELLFDSGQSSFGYVSKYLFRNGRQTFSKINFGHLTDDKRLLSRLSQNDLYQPKSLVDDVNEQVATAVHEFAHVISIAKYSQFNRDSDFGKFWDEMSKLFRKYKKESLNMDQELVDVGDKHGFFSKQFDKAYINFRQNNLGDYATSNVDEFFAESFANYNLNSNPSKWALEVKKIVDKFFLK